MSLRVALIGGLFAVGLLLSVLIGLVGVRTIRSSVFAEAQKRANHSLDMAGALYELQIENTLARLDARLEAEDPDRLLEADRLRRLRVEFDFDVLSACGPGGEPLSGQPAGEDERVPVTADPMLRKALRGKSAAGTLKLTADRIALEGGERLRALTAVPPPEAGAGPGTAAALFQWYAWPLRDERGGIRALIYGGRTLNHHLELVDALHRIVFGDERYGGKPVGTLTLFLDTVRVATNVLDAGGRRALGTEVSGEVRRAVLENGRVWRDRAWVVDAWYLSGYSPLKDPDGDIIGMLYVGLLEAPYLALRNELVRRFLLPASLVLLVGLALGSLTVQRITQPLARLTRAAQELERGEGEARFGFASMFSEVDRLSGALAGMQSALAERDARLKRQNQALEQVNANYMSTLGFVTHEIKSPLAAIQSFADLLVAGDVGRVDERASELLVRIKRNCEELQDMVKNYLDLSRAERGELAPSFREIDLHTDVVAPAVEQSTPLLASRGMEIHVDCPPDVRLEADPELLRIAVGNYLSNAAKYGREGGRVRLNAATEGATVLLSVENPGAGFGPEEGAQLFRKFSRLSNANTRGKRGSGLGLFLVHQIAELHRGSVGAASSPGEWARFDLRLPLS